MNTSSPVKFTFTFYLAVASLVAAGAAIVTASINAPWLYAASLVATLVLAAATLDRIVAHRQAAVAKNG